MCKKQMTQVNKDAELDCAEGQLFRLATTKLPIAPDLMATPAVPPPLDP